MDSGSQIWWWGGGKFGTLFFFYLRWNREKGREGGRVRSVHLLYFPIIIFSRERVLGIEGGEACVYSVLESLNSEMKFIFVCLLLGL